MLVVLFPNKLPTSTSPRQMRTDAVAPAIHTAKAEPSSRTSAGSKLGESASPDGMRGPSQPFRID